MGRGAGAGGAGGCGRWLMLGLTACDYDGLSCRGVAASRAAVDKCAAALQADCGAEHGDIFECASCAGKHQQGLRAAGCDNSAIAAWCAATIPVMPTNHFPGSRIMLSHATWGDAVNGWTGAPPAQVWSLCYSSVTDNHDNATTFHTQCDQHSRTVAFARNSLGYTFGGYVRLFVSCFCLPSSLFSQFALFVRRPGHGV